MQRFYLNEKLTEKLKIQEIEMYNQITRVLRARV